MENIVDGTQQPQDSFEVNLDTLDGGQAAEPKPDDSEAPDVHTQNGNQFEDIQIDERFKDLDENEGRLRTLQSQRDTYRADIDKWAKKYDERDAVAALLDDMLEDDGLFMAFVSERKPELIKNRDVAGELKQQLKEEFGDFKPQLSREEAERDDPFGQDARYYMRLDELKTKLRQGGTNEEQAKSVKEYLKKRKELQEKEAQKYEMERETVKNQLKMTDTEVKAVSDWAMKLKFGDIVKIHRYLRRLPSKNPNLTSVPGEAPGKKSAREAFLKEVF